MGSAKAASKDATQQDERYTDGNGAIQRSSVSLARDNRGRLDGNRQRRYHTVDWNANA